MGQQAIRRIVEQLLTLFGGLNALAVTPQKRRQHQPRIGSVERIGQEVAVRARSFGMRIVAHDPFITQEIAESMGAELLTLDEVCAGADFLTLHLPATPETRHLFNDARFGKVKPGLRIINTARGELIDEAALKRALEVGTVAAAGLDVFEKEPPADWALAHMPQVVATPHIAASTEEAQELVGLDTAAAVRDCHHRRGGQRRRQARR